MSVDRQLITYLPEVLKDYREFKLIMGVEQPELETLWDVLVDALDDQFIWDATENGVNRWESILKLYPKASDSLDDRKFRIIAKINQQLPFTITSLHQQLINLCGNDGYTVELQNALHKLIVRVALTRKANYEDAEKTAA